MPKSCPRGSVYRKAHTKKTSSGKKTKVKASCSRRRNTVLNKDVEALLKKILKSMSPKRPSRKSLKCPNGFIKRSAYTRRAYTKTDKSGRRRKISSAKVPASCIRDLGRSGKGKKLFSKLKKGDLKRFGYQNIKSLTLEQRKRALKKAVNYYGYLPVIKKLNAVYVLTRSSDPKLASKIKRDQQMISREHNKRNLTKSIRR